MSWEKINGLSFVGWHTVKSPGGSVSSQMRDLHFIKSIPSALQPLRGSGLFLPPSCQGCEQPPALPCSLCPTCSYNKRLAGEAAAPQVIDHLGVTGLWASENQKTENQKAEIQKAEIQNMFLTNGYGDFGDISSWRLHILTAVPGGHGLQISKLMFYPGLVEDQACCSQHGPG